MLLFTTALALLVSAFNVRYRDTQHLVELGLLAWFWLTPIVYPAGAIAQKFADGRLVVRSVPDQPAGGHRPGLPAGALRGRRGRDRGREVRARRGHAILPDPGIAYYALRLGIVGAASLLLLYLSWRYFFNRSGDFAEEL